MIMCSKCGKKPAVLFAKETKTKRDVNFCLPCAKEFGITAIDDINFMKAGMIRKIDDLGRVVIPKEIRDILFIDNGDPLEIFVDKGAIVLKKYDSEKPILKHLYCIHQKIYDIHDDDKRVLFEDKLSELIDILEGGDLNE